MTTASTSPAPAGPQSFSYAAQTLDGEPISGTIDAPSLELAASQLNNLRLRIIRLDPAEQRRPAKPLSGDDFTAFNQQLAYLSAAGLPIEQGLRLIADDLRHGGLAQSVRDVSAELERGVPLGDAFQKHEKRFPPLYGTLIHAGVRSGNLPGVLLNLGRHLELMSRLRAGMWRAAAYPLAVMAGLLLVLLFVSQFILPQFEQMYMSWYFEIPAITRLFFAVARWIPTIIVVCTALFIGIPLLWMLLRVFRLDRSAADAGLWVPVLGSLLRRNLIARWCDAMALTIRAGLDLPAAIGLTGDIVGSPALRRDGAILVSTLTAGRTLGDFDPRGLSVLPATVVAVIRLASDRNDLPEALQTLSTMYQQQAELRLTQVQNLLTPLLMLFAAAMIGATVLALFAPMISLIQSIM